jgi:hypothetical protein
MFLHCRYAGELHEDIEFQGATEAQESMGVAIALALLSFYRSILSYLRKPV